jgi:hypothetical protein
MRGRLEREPRGSLSEGHETVHTLGGVQTERPCRRDLSSRCANVHQWQRARRARSQLERERRPSCGPNRSRGPGGCDYLPLCATILQAGKRFAVDSACGYCLLLAERAKCSKRGQWRAARQVQQVPINLCQAPLASPFGMTALLCPWNATVAAQYTPEQPSAPGPALHDNTALGSALGTSPPTSLGNFRQGTHASVCIHRPLLIIDRRPKPPARISQPLQQSHAFRSAKPNRRRGACLCPPMHLKWNCCVSMSLFT